MVTRALEKVALAKRVLREITLLRHFAHENITGLIDVDCSPDLSEMHVFLSRTRPICRKKLTRITDTSSWRFVTLVRGALCDWCSRLMYVLQAYGRFALRCIPCLGFVLNVFAIFVLAADLHQIIKSGQALTNEHVQYFVYQVLRGMPEAAASWRES